MKRFIFCSLTIMLFGCANQNQTAGTDWVEKPSPEENKKNVALNDCKTIASDKAGKRPTHTQTPRCSPRFDPSCAFTQSEIADKNKEAQQAWQQTFDSTLQLCMNNKGYEKG